MVDDVAIGVVGGHEEDEREKRDEEEWEKKRERKDLSTKYKDDKPTERWEARGIWRAGRWDGAEKEQEGRRVEGKKRGEENNMKD